MDRFYRMNGQNGSQNEDGKKRQRQLLVEPLAKHHDRQGFCCGSDALDNWLRKQAGQEQRRNISRTFVLVERDRPEIRGFYSLSSISIDLNSLPPSLAAKLPRYPENPAGLIGRLAVAAKYQGQGIGKALLHDALMRLARLGRELACHAVIVDAKDKAARRFYTKFGFASLHDNPDRLFLQMKTVAKGLCRNN